MTTLLIDQSAAYLRSYVTPMKYFRWVESLDKVMVPRDSNMIAEGELGGWNVRKSR
jgi:hypothetical protein